MNPSLTLANFKPTIHQRGLLIIAKLLLFFRDAKMLFKCKTHMHDYMFMSQDSFIYLSTLCNYLNFLNGPSERKKILNGSCSKVNIVHYKLRF